MKKSEIQVGHIYEAKVNSRLTKVVVNDVTKTPKGLTRYHVTNLATARKTVLCSTVKFLREVVEKSPKKAEQPALFNKEVPSKIAKPSLAGKIQEAATSMPVPPHLIVIARAGTGKTTTLVEGLRSMRGQTPRITPSPQQKAVWESMEASCGAKTVCFVAFNKSIATELQQRVPEGCDAMTMHAMGYKAVRGAFPSLGSPNSYRVQDILSELLERDIRELRKDKPETIQAVEKLVGLCKMNLCDSTPDELEELAAYYEVELNGNAREVFDLVPRILERCKRVDLDNTIDFNDMIWLPVVLNLPVTKYDVLLVDEAQDLNRCQQQLALKAGRRLILCGDDRQAIYGFAGADSESLKRMAEILGAMPQGVVTLPLTVTRRCAKRIVREAQEFVKDFEAFESNPDGFVLREKLDGTNNYRDAAINGDMVVCRVTAPLVSECFRFLKAGRKANIQGRDIGQSLISTIQKQKADDVIDLQTKLEDWLRNEVRKENAKRNPNESKIIGLQDRYDCISCFMEGCFRVDDVVAKIQSVFTDEKQAEGVRLSTIHKAKGLEAQTVFFLEPKGATCPHPMARSAWQKAQEYNLRYVAITRAIARLVYVS